MSQGHLCTALSKNGLCQPSLLPAGFFHTLLPPVAASGCLLIQCQRAPVSSLSGHRAQRGRVSAVPGDRVGQDSVSGQVPEKR